MIDSGCNGMLLTIPEKKLENLVKKFPRGSDYNWEVTGGGGISTVPSINLSINKRSGKSFDLDIATDLGGFTVSLRNARFHLCWDDALELRDIVGTDYHELNQFIKTGEELTKIGITIAKRRDHCLLGQTALFGKTSVQHSNGVWMLFEPDFQYTKKIVDDFAILIKSYGQKFFLDHPKFSTLEDDDHDGELDNDEIEYWGDDDYKRMDDNNFL